MATNLKTILENVVTAIGKDIKSLKDKDIKLNTSVETLKTDVGTKLGDLTTLTTTDKTSVVRAMNELKASIGAVNTGTDESAVNQLIDNKINALVDNAPEALNTLKEIADKLQADESTATALASTVSKKVAFDSAQSLSTEQQKQAQENIGLGSVTDLDLMAKYTTARDTDEL